MLEFTLEHLDLIRAVNLIDTKAAAWMLDQVEEKAEVVCECYHANVGELACVFPWDDTPQGHAYWENIHKRLEAMKNGQ